MQCRFSRGDDSNCLLAVLFLMGKGYEDDHKRADQSQGLPALLPADDIRASSSG